MIRHSRLRVSPSHPEAAARCDRCSRIYNHSDLRFQQEWAGVKLINTRWLVCRECYDMPAVAKRTILLPPDPVPIANPRPQQTGVDDTAGAGYDTSAIDLLFPVPD